MAVSYQILLRLLAVLGLSVFVYRIYELVIVYGGAFTWNLKLLLLGEIITIFLVVFARFAKQVKFNFIAILITFIASFYFLLIDFSSGNALLPTNVTAGLSLFGIVFQIFAKLSLGFSFGLLPANRGIVSRGAYQLVRHPIYLGYFLNHMGYLLSNFSLWNFSVFSALYCVQIVRILQEEKVLFQDEAYRNYAQKVKYRIIPFIF